jgi:6-phosphogluconolactonase
MANQQLVYVGTYSEPILFGTGEVLQGRGKGIYAFRLNEAAGALEPVGITEGVRNSSFLAFDPEKEFLYCVNEFKEYEGMASGAVSSFRMDRESGALTYLNTKASHGTDPCHLMVDRSGRNVLVANFASGSVSVLPREADGSLKEASCVIQHEGSSVDPKRQTGPHAHGVEIDAANRYVFVPELGLDKIMIYELDAERGQLTPNPHQPTVDVTPGSGPRQIVLHRNGRFTYVMTEMSSSVIVYSYDAATGGLKELQTLSTLPADFSGESSGAEVQVAPSGKFLYASNRGHDSLATFAIDSESGKLTLAGFEGSGGKIPRNFDVSPDGAFVAVANQDSNNVVLFRVDQATGKPAPTGNVVEAGTPICVRFL